MYKFVNLVFFLGSLTPPIVIAKGGRMEPDPTQGPAFPNI